MVKQIGNDWALGVEDDAGRISAIEHMTLETVKLPGKMDILMACAGKLSMRDVGRATEKTFIVPRDSMLRGHVFFA